MTTVSGKRSLLVIYKVLAAAIFGFGLMARGGAAESEPTPAAVVVTPRNYYVRQVFDQLAAHGGPKVFVLGGWQRPFVTPEELRFRPVDGSRLVDAVAAKYELKVKWVRGRSYAVLFSGASSQEIDRVKHGLTSVDAADRRDAAWRGGWLRDVRVVPLLVKAAQDADAEVVRQAMVGLRRMTWDAVLTLDDDGFELLDAELASSDSVVRRGVAEALRSIDPERAFPHIEKAFANQDAGVRCRAVKAMEHIEWEKALPSIEKALADRNTDVRREAVGWLWRMGGTRTLPLIDKAFADQDCLVRGMAASALGNVGAEEGLPRIEKALASEDHQIRSGAAGALGRISANRDCASKIVCQPRTGGSTSTRRSLFSTRLLFCELK